MGTNLKFKLSFLCILPYLHSFCQSDPATLQRYLGSADNELSARLPAIRKFYAAIDYQLAWMTIPGQQNRHALLELIDNSSLLGLKKTDYSYNVISSSQANLLHGAEDSLMTDIRFTDAAIHFFTDLAHGNTAPDLRYYGFEYTPSRYDIPQLILQYCKLQSLALLPGKLEAPMPVIRAILRKLSVMEHLRSDSVSREERITSSTVNHSNKPLLKKLYYLGIADSLVKKTDTGIKGYVIEAQKQFNLLADGVLRSTLLQELNTPVATRIRQLHLALNYYRWIYCLSQSETTIVVNIPAAYMTVYDLSGIRLEMKMVVGKYSTPTPTLSSRISDVILYPYWHVPKSIIFNELLPAIKKNPSFIDYNNFQVINNQGKIIDPYNINWNLLSRSNFPYIIRQSTGCDNSLGMVKLNFYSPFGVYLHDTPLKTMFMANKRYFSHGCMRMEKPMELARLVIPVNTAAIDTVEEKGCVINEKPINIPAEKKMPVIVWYNPVGIDSRGEVVFFEDIYRKFK